MHSYSYLLSIPIDLIEARIEVYPLPERLWNVQKYVICELKVSLLLKITIYRYSPRTLLASGYPPGSAPCPLHLLSPFTCSLPSPALSLHPVATPPQLSPPTATRSGLRCRYYFLPSGALVTALGIGALGSHRGLLRGPFGGHTESDVVYTRVYCSVHVGIQLCTRVYTFPL